MDDLDAAGQHMQETLRMGAGIFPEPYRSRMLAHIGDECTWDPEYEGIYCLTHDVEVLPAPTELVDAGVRPALADEDVVTLRKVMRGSVEKYEQEWEKVHGQQG